MNESAHLLNHLFAKFGTYFVELTYIDPKRHYELEPHIYTESYMIGTDRIDWDHVAEQNKRGYSVYYAVTPKHRPTPRFNRSKELDAAYCQAMWVDIDLQDGHYANLDAAFQALATYKPVPTVIIETGGGLHGIWRIEPVAVSRKMLPIIKAHLRGLAQDLRADTSVAELARVLRLPGTVNTKPDRAAVVCKLADGHIVQATYTLERFPKAEIPQHVDRPMRSGPPSGLPSYVNWYLTTPFEVGNRNNALNWTAFMMSRDGFNEQDAVNLLLTRAVNSGLDERNALATIRSPFKAGVRNG